MFMLGILKLDRDSSYTHHSYYKRIIKSVEILSKNAIVKLKKSTLNSHYYLYSVNILCQLNVQIKLTPSV